MGTKQMDCLRLLVIIILSSLNCLYANIESKNQELLRSIREKPGSVLIINAPAQRLPDPRHPDATGVRAVRFDGELVHRYIEVGRVFIREEGSPQRFVDTKEQFPANITAAFTGPDREVYLFRGKQFCKRPLLVRNGVECPHWYENSELFGCNSPAVKTLPICLDPTIDGVMSDRKDRSGKTKIIYKGGAKVKLVIGDDPTTGQIVGYQSPQMSTMESVQAVPPPSGSMVGMPPPNSQSIAPTPPQRQPVINNPLPNVPPLTNSQMGGPPTQQPFINNPLPNVPPLTNSQMGGPPTQQPAPLQPPPPMLQQIPANTAPPNIALMPTPAPPLQPQPPLQQPPLQTNAPNIGVPMNRPWLQSTPQPGMIASTIPPEPPFSSQINTGVGLPPIGSPPSITGQPLAPGAIGAPQMRQSISSPPPSSIGGAPPPNQIGGQSPPPQLPPPMAGVVPPSLPGLPTQTGQPSTAQPHIIPKIGEIIGNMTKKI